MVMPVMVLVRTVFRVKGSVCQCRLNTEAFHHVIQQMIMTVGEPSRIDLDRHMPVAQMIGNAHQQ